MTDTTDYEYLLDLRNVNAVDVRSDGTVVAFVEQKVPESELASNQIVANAVTDEPTDVIEIGEVRALSEVHRSRHRPVRGGSSEGPIARRMAGTGGPLAVVDDKYPEFWAPSVSVGDIVRLSNNHVYAGVAELPGNFGAEIAQPARLDGGVQSDVVGELVGYVPISEGVETDVAARTTQSEGEGEDSQFVGNPPIADKPTIPEGEYDQLAGQQLVKSGRTTGVTSGEVLSTSASVRVNMGGNPELVVVFRDQIVATHMSIAGDSGSSVGAPMYGEDGGFAGLLFAGSSSSTIINKAANIEKKLGVSFDLPDDSVTEPDEHQLRVESGSGRWTFAYSFDFVGEIEAKGRSITVVGDRVNAWTLGWGHSYTLRGYVTNVSVPDGVEVKVDGETVAPAEVPEKTGHQP